MGGGHLLFVFKGSGKIKAAFKTGRVGDGGDGKLCVFQKHTGLTNAEICKIFLWRLSQHLAEGPMEMTAADPGIVSDFFYGNRVGEVAVDIIRGLMNINFIAIRRGTCGMIMDKQGQGAV